MRYTYILFDADNTLLDFDAAERHALSQTLSHFGYEPTEKVLREYHKINDNWWRRFERGEATTSQLYTGRFAQLAQAFDFSYDAQEFHNYYERALGEHGELFDGASELIADLHDRGCRLYITTNGNPRVQHPRLDRSPIRDMLDGVYISMEIGHKKPEREYFDYVLEDIGCDERDRVLVVGDSLRSDISGGAGAGLDTCWYAPNGSLPVGGVQPTYIARSYDDILNIVCESEKEPEKTKKSGNRTKAGKTARKNIYRFIFTLLTLLMLFFIFGNSAADSDTSGGISMSIVTFINERLANAGIALSLTDHIVRKAAHFTEFSVLGVLYTITVRLWKRDMWRFGAVWLPLACGLITAAADEYLQTFVPGRSGQLSDVALDFCGVLWAALATSAFFTVRMRKSVLESEKS